MPNVTKRTVDAAKPTAKKYFVWDGKLSGFGLQVAPTGHKTFIVQYRTLERAAPDLIQVSHFNFL
ncbi:Arm DNA-binding domain-containing protein [Pseudovibrio sp. Ad37]|uniref:Arm DNA-binding domain-containing protein n=1 Tax=Pseudovibrio sp. Ad37 TaxID=989422 RepID=UPI0007AE6949|nr:Arm DNA-binding domain-containing protein [Pseudovibrio sp. Ad37]KZL14961.1 hypothetical protein PsAD37_04494 [Pseudovibrio sp. Ad37]